MTGTITTRLRNRNGSASNGTAPHDCGVSVREILTAVKGIPAIACEELGVEPDLLSDFLVSQDEQAAVFSVPISGISLVMQSTADAMPSAEVDSNPLTSLAGPTVTLVVKPGADDHCYILRDPRGIVKDCVVDYRAYTMEDRRRQLGFLLEILRGDRITSVSDVFTPVTSVTA